MKKLNALYVALTALVVAVVALVMCLVCCSKNKSASVEEVLQSNPGLVVEAMQNYEVQAREEALQKAREMIKENEEALNNNPNDGVLGNPNGEVVLVEFFDFSCGYCHRLYPALKSVIAKNPDLKVVAKSLTFVSPISQFAAKAALAAKEQGKYAEAYSALFEYKGRLTEDTVIAAIAATGVDVEKLKADMNSPKVEQALKEMADLAGKIQITGVPTLVMNGKVVQTLDENVIQQEIEAAR